jgi:hypothetical protein
MPWINGQACGRDMDSVYVHQTSSDLPRLIAILAGYTEVTHACKDDYGQHGT